MAQLHSLPFLRDFLTAEDKEGVFNADHFPLWYKRAAEQVPGTFVYSIPFSTGTVNATKPYLAGRTLHIKYMFCQLQNYSGFSAATWKPNPSSDASY